jgi:membrane protease YdiL (CAAX protease family)
MLTSRWVAFSRFFLGIAVVIAAHFIASGFVPRDLPFLRSNLVYRPVLLVFLMSGFSIVVSGFDRVGGNPLAAIGLAMRRPWLLDLWTGSVLGAGMVAVAVAVIAIAGRLTIRLDYSRESAFRAAVVVIILAAGAMAEEISFRGYPFQRLVAATGPGPAIGIFSLLFGIVHLANPDASAWGFLNTVLIGVLLALAYLRTQSLWLPIAIHFWWNITLGLIFGLGVSGLHGFSVIARGRLDGPLWLTGGGYGIEASAISVIVIFAGIAVLMVFVPAREPVSLPSAEDSLELPDASGTAGGNLLLPEPEAEENRSGAALPPASPADLEGEEGFNNP